jgi:hypothetical protein
MLSLKKVFSLLSFVFVLHAADANALSGLITNVQSHSSNPFHNPMGSYNQRPPVPFFAQGTSLNAGDCMNVVHGIIVNECGRRNNCAGMRVHDIRPIVLQQLAAIPGANYISACAGFVDGMFDEYMKSVAVPVQSAQQPQTQPLTPTRSVPPPRNLAAESELRAGNLDMLHMQTAPDTRLVATAMPTTFDDLSFVERQQIIREGIEPWRDAVVYRTIRIESDEARWQREQQETAARKAALTAIGLHALCVEFPDAAGCEDWHKARDYCAWCRANLPACVTEINNMNQEIVRRACAERTDDNEIVSVHLHVDPVNCAVGSGGLPPLRTNAAGEPLFENRRCPTIPQGPTCEDRLEETRQRVIGSIGIEAVNAIEREPAFVNADCESRIQHMIFRASNRPGTPGTGTGTGTGRGGAIGVTPIGQQGERQRGAVIFDLRPGENR